MVQFYLVWDLMRVTNPRTNSWGFTSKADNIMLNVWWRTFGISWSFGFQHIHPSSSWASGQGVHLVLYQSQYYVTFGLKKGLLNEICNPNLTSDIWLNPTIKHLEKINDRRTNLRGIRSKSDNIILNEELDIW